MESCPDNLPEYLAAPKLSRFRGYIQKRYEDGFVSIIGPPAVPGSINEVQYTESRFLDGSKHFETIGKPEFYSKNDPEDDGA